MKKLIESLTCFVFTGVAGLILKAYAGQTSSNKVLLKTSPLKVSSYQNNIGRITALLIMVIIALPGCADRVRTIPELGILKPSQYHYCQEEKGLRIALDPIMEEDRLKTYFGEDLLKLGIMPVLVVAENEGADSCYLIEEKRFAVKIKEGYRFKGKDPYTKDTLAHEKVLTLAKGRVLTPGESVAVLTAMPLIGVIPLALLLDQRKAQMDYVYMNIKNRSFVDRTVYPGETHSGFIYFRVPGREAVNQIDGINLTVKDLRSEKEQEFTFDFTK
jgi:hypothetical protein